MDYLKMDVNILFSIINTKLRDYYQSLDELCDDLEIDKEGLLTKFKNANYEYDTKLNQFK